MNTMIKKTATLLGLIIFTFTACSKYESGPDITIIPRKDRVANTWVIEKALENGEDVTDQFDNYELYLTRDGDAELDAHYTVFGETFEYQTNGTWEFQNDDENISFDFEDNSADGTYQILKLTETEMWLREIGADLELQLQEK